MTGLVDPRTTDGGHASDPPSDPDGAAGAVPDPAADGPLTDAEAEQIATTASAVVSAMGTVIEGKRSVAELTVLVMLSGGHLLVEDVPGVGKTMLAKSLAAALRADRRRIQFTPDLLPGDITGASVFNQGTREFEFRPGAVFTQVLLADEINRASPKTQSALLEAMEERQVSADGSTYALPEPFMVLATANPVEMEGTYRLPEAQRDRFLAQTSMGYPDPRAEARMIDHQTGPLAQEAHDPVDLLEAVTDPATIAAHTTAIRRVHVAPDLLDYVVRLASAARDHPHVVLGASPRAAVHLVRAAKAHAALRVRTYVRPEDVRAVLEPVWRHRLHLSPQALSRGTTADEVLSDILGSTPLSP